MRIEQTHSLGQKAARSRIDQFLDQLVQKPPGGVTVKDAQRSWEGNRMTFSFTAARGFLGTSIKGTMDVTDEKVVVESELPSLVRNLLGEDRVRQALADGLDKMLKP
jgi:hypothetical protein